MHMVETYGKVKKKKELEDNKNHKFMHKEKELLCNFELFRKFPEEGKQNHRKIKLQRTRHNVVCSKKGGQYT